jgi:serine phosphatase RsbU (regulator of sigma subunit)
MAAVAKSLDDSFRQSHNSEIAHDDESRRRLAEAYRANQQAQQQQQIINQNQQIINNQIQQNMKPPAPRTPIQTDCYRMGNSVSCTSQ